MIEAQGLGKAYQLGERDIPVLRSISLSVPEGGFWAIMGPSGAGKSTLLNVLGCLDTPTTGSYRLAGNEVAGLDDRELARLRNRFIGFVFQFSHFVDYLSLVDNVALPGFYARESHQESRAKALELLDKVGLGHRAEHGAHQLSGGELQRASLARALFNQPRLLLADEPTGNLDAKNTAQLMDLLHGLNSEGIAVVMVTHDPQVAARAERRFTLADGGLREEA